MYIKDDKKKKKKKKSILEKEIEAMMYAMMKTALEEPMKDLFNGFN